MEISAAVGRYRDWHGEYPIKVFKTALQFCDNLDKKGFPLSILQTIVEQLIRTSSDAQKFKCPRRMVSVNYTNMLIEDTFFPPTRLIGLLNNEAIKFKFTSMAKVNLQLIANPKIIRKNVNIYRYEIYGTYKKWIRLRYWQIYYGYLVFGRGQHSNINCHKYEIKIKLNFKSKSFWIWQSVCFFFRIISLCKSK